MGKLYRSMLLCCIVLFLSLVGMKVDVKAAQDKSYSISNYDFNAKVSEKNVWHITEKITYDFKRPHHGPVRQIICSSNWKSENQEVWVDGEIHHFSVECKDASSFIANKAIVNTGEQEYVSYSIGSKHKMVTGKHTYVLKYDLQFFTDLNEVNFNVIGTNWQCEIEHAKWKIEMPKKFDSSKVGYSVGIAGSTDYDESLLFSDVSGKRISGEYFESLLPFNGITVRCKLPQGYFKAEKRSFVPYVIGAAGCFILMLVLWFVNKQKVIPVIEFYPPNDLDPIEVERIYNDCIDHATALLPYLANLGYLRIIRGSNVEENRSCLSKVFDQVTGAKVNENIRFELLDDDTSGLSEYAKIFMRGLFGNKKVVALSELDDFCVTVSRIKSLANKESPFTKRNRVLRILYILLAWVISALLIVGNSRTSHEMFAGSFNVVFVGLVIGSVLLFTIACSKKRFFIVSMIFVVGLLIMFKFLGIPLWMLVTILAVAVLASVLCVTQKHRKPEELELYGQVIGFRNFLKIAEADRLRQLVDMDPEYFYSVLGYAYVFGLEKKWMKKFEELGIMPEVCEWYSCGTDGAFLISDFNNSFSSMMESASDTMLSSADIDSGFSGGGFSGFGGAGGGGGAW